ncbi:MAG: flagellar basal body-associated protein FliL [Methylotenera sp.]|jgi:flagellar FliL protein|uniref:Flagellar protein FliL n=1 Tax=Methylotenera mobilis TaxID=359408 RepID=A0A351R939_9PROT|nr:MULTISPECIES: flagellar basal body-associated protein FliL [Methylotenera]HBA08560.1 flagellar basal body-associated protein FliL [Methylotenera mobilis]MDP3086609.1 flagellar basal body-associated protein FliL [Methylotenera sp.]MDP3776494.1 flagellar basal body-associated protein FliL [Methylotenera sp.]PPC98134.1 MAG: flagellar basal body-associated protein FliL [Methylotenera sp.]PPD48086.1 MAG: flagellar basal body-associated protein FliL [Methylotenera sp.]
MAQDPKQESQEAAPASKKKLIIIIAAVVLALGGGGGAWFFMQQKSHDKKEEVKKEEPAKAPVFLTLDTFTVNLQPDPDEKFLQVDISLQVASPEEAEKIKLHMPSVKNRLLLLLTSKSAAEISTVEGKQDLSNQIIEEVKKPFPPDTKPQEILDVFFTSFVVQ